MSDIGATTTQQTPPAQQTAAAARTAAADTASTAAEQARNVAGTAREGGQAVTEQAREQVGRVANEATSHVRQLVDQTRGDLRQQAEQGATRAATQLSELGQQLQALAQGRTEEAGRVGDFASQAAQQLTSLSQRLEGGGLDGMLGEMRTFARRRPVSFLAGALAAGFLAGRVASGAREASQSSGSINQGMPAMPVSPAMGTSYVGDLSEPIGAPLAGSGVNAQIVDDPAMGGGGSQLFGVGSPERGDIDITSIPESTEPRATGEL